MVTETSTKLKSASCVASQKLTSSLTKNNILLQYEAGKASPTSRTKTKSILLKPSTHNALLHNLERKSTLNTLTSGACLENKLLSESRQKHDGLRLSAKPTTLANPMLSRLSDTVTGKRSSAKSLENPILQKHMSAKSLENPILRKHSFAVATQKVGLRLTQNNLHVETQNKLLAPIFHASARSVEPVVERSSAPLNDEKLAVCAAETSPLCHKDIENLALPDRDVKFPTAEDFAPGSKVIESSTEVAKAYLISCVCTSLVNNPVWFSSVDKTRSSLHNISQEVADNDPEFVLKVALYTRLTLNIRATSNFLLALAAYLPPCRPFLKKYFCKAIVLPSDWIQVAEFYQSLSEPEGSKNVKLPAALRRVMVTKFPEFDEYQLGKYNKDKAKSVKKKDKPPEKQKEERRGKGKRARRVMAGEGGSEGAVEKQQFDVPSFTLKYLIRKLHLTKPAYPVMCILGKKYPENVDAYYRSGLEGTWDSALIGKRMKLQVPETWETQVSAKGNRAQVWEDLLSHRKLPFMAMLRNLRNMIKAGISEPFHTQILKTLSNERAVTKSRQFPFRFFSAYEVLKELEADIEKQARYKEKGCKGFLTPHQKNVMKDTYFGRPRSEEEKEIDTLKKRLHKQYGQPLPFDQELIQRYRKALNEAVKIATVHNVPPIVGHTVVICDVRPKLLQKKCASARGLGSVRSISEIGILLGIMCSYSCEACTFLLCSGKMCKTIELENCGILENLSRIMALLSVQGSQSNNNHFLPKGFFRDAVVDRIKFDNLLILSSALEQKENADLQKFLQRYSDGVNSGAKCYTVDLTGKKPSMPDEVSAQNITKFSGYSEQILKFIALGSGKAQLNMVSSIDKKYDLLADEAVPVSTDVAVASPVRHLPLKPWRTVRVFISSTIKDMMSERDALVGHVFPYLRDRAKQMSVHLVETDLRWGITADDSRYDRSIGICLQEVRKCDIFLGILGERYGWVPKDYGFPETGSNWLNAYPRGRSITELEINQAAFAATRKKCFFYFRDSTDLKGNVPKHMKDRFFESTSHRRSKLRDLKVRIRDSEHTHLDSYSVEWKGIRNGKPEVEVSDSFVDKVTEDLVAAIEELVALPESTNVLSGGHGGIENKDPHLRVASEHTFEGRSSLFAMIISKVTAAKSGGGNIVALTGKPGSGKSTLISAVYKHLAENVQDGIACIHFSCSTICGSEFVSNVLYRFCIQIKRAFHLDNANVLQDCDGLLRLFPELLDKVALVVGKPKLYLLVDDLHHLGADIEWISKISRPFVTLLLTCPESSSTHRALKHLPGVVFQHMSDLNPADKRQIVRSMLGSHSKKLDESHFNNQMQALLSKRSSTNPLYLKTVCDMIRVQETFETLSGTIKSLPHDLDGVLEWQLGAVESRYEKYTSLVGTVLGVIYCSIDRRISEEDLYSALLLVYSKENSSSGKTIPRPALSSLIHSLKSFIMTSPTENGQLLSFTHAVHTKLVENRYLSDQRAIESHHALLASLYVQKLRECSSATTKDTYMIAQALMRLPTHLAFSKQYDTLRNLLTDFDYVLAKCKLGIGVGLPEEYGLLDHANSKKKGLKKNGDLLVPWQEMQKFVTSHIHIIYKYPEMLYQFAFNQDSDSYPYVVSSDRQCDNPSTAVVYVEHLNRFDGFESDTRTFREGDGSDKQTCVTLCDGGSLLAYGTGSGKVAVFDHETGRDVFAWLGHTDSVSSLCFVSTSTLVSACADGTVSVWNVIDGYRMHSFKAHYGRISGMSVRPASQGSSARVFVTSSHDRSIAIWKADGKFQSRLKTGGSPANCVAFHPHQPRVVVGLWDCSLRIWDVQTLKRVAVIRGHSHAVSAAQYSACGTYIASCSRYESVIRLWAAGAGIPLGNFAENFLTSPTALAYSSAGDGLIGAGEGTNEHGSQLVTWSSHLGKEELEYQIPSGVESGNATCCGFSSDKDMLAVGFHSGLVVIYDAKASTPLYQELLCDVPVTCLTWSPSPDSGVFTCLLFGSITEQVMVCGFSDGTLKVIFRETFSEVASLKGHKGGVLALDCSAEWIASGAEDFDILLWSLEMVSKPDWRDEVQVFQNTNQNTAIAAQGPKVVTYSKVLRGHDGPVSCVAFNPDGSMLVSGGRDGKLVYWRIASEDQLNMNLANTNQSRQDPKPYVTINQAHMDWITCCSWNDSSDHVVTGSNDANLKVWAAPKYPLDGSRQHLNPLYIIKGHESGVTSVRYRLGCISSTGGEDRTIRIWSHRGVEITSLKTPTRTNCCDVTLRTEVTDPSEATLDFEQGPQEDLNWAEEVAKEEWNEEHEKRKPGSKKKKKAVTTEMQNFQVVCASNDSSLTLWKPLVGHRTSVMSSNSKYVKEVVAAGADKILTCSSAGSIKQWCLKVDKECSRHEGEVTGIVVICQLVVTSCDAGYMYVWDVTDEGHEIRLLCKKECHKKRITCMVAIEEKGIVTTSHDGSVTFWSLAVAENDDQTAPRNVRLAELKTEQLSCPLASCTVEKMASHYNVVVSDIEGVGTIIKAPAVLSKSTAKDDKQVNGPDKEMHIELEDSVFIHTVATVGGISADQRDIFVAGCSQGVLHVPSQNKKLRIHDSRVTVLLDAGDVLVSGSFDCTVKLWRKPDLTQVGHFSTRSPVTAATLMTRTDLLLYGDSSGMLNVLKLRR